MMTEIDKLRDTLDEIGLPYVLAYKERDMTGHWTITVRNTHFVFHERTGKFLALVVDETERGQFVPRESCSVMSQAS